MKREFEIYNYKFKEVQGYLYYDTDKDRYSMRLLPSYKGMHPDCTFMELNKQGIVYVPQDIVDMWVHNRVIPPNRQGLEGILKEMGLSEYNVFDLLMLTGGTCELDYSGLREIPYDGKDK